MKSDDIHQNWHTNGVILKFYVRTPDSHEVILKVGIQ